MPPIFTTCMVKDYLRRAPTSELGSKLMRRAFDERDEILLGAKALAPANARRSTAARNDDILFVLLCCVCLRTVFLFYKFSRSCSRVRATSEIEQGGGEKKIKIIFFKVKILLIQASKSADVIISEF